jgi:hypothetical protein
MADETGLEEAQAGLAGQVARGAGGLEKVENQSVKRDAKVAAPVRPDGLQDRVETDFPYPEWRLQRAALAEYRRTIEEFRQTGAVEEKAWRDFTHLTNPPMLRRVVFRAYHEACEEIERWKIERGIASAEADSQRLDADEDGSRESGLDESDADKREDHDENVIEENEAAEEEADKAKLRALLEHEVRTRAARAAPGAEISALMPAPAEAAPAPVILRGVEFDPYAPAHWTRREPRLPQLNIAPPPDLPAANDRTESLLNDIIGECHFLMREVAFRSLCQEQAAEDRVSWVNTALRMAETGAKVAKSVARLRHGPAIRESHQKITVENKVAVVQGGGGPAP